MFALIPTLPYQHQGAVQALEADLEPGLTQQALEQVAVQVGFDQPCPGTDRMGPVAVGAGFRRRSVDVAFQAHVLGA